MSLLGFQKPLSTNKLFIRDIEAQVTSLRPRKSGPLSDVSKELQLDLTHQLCSRNDLQVKTNKQKNWHPFQRKLNRKETIKVLNTESKRHPSPSACFLQVTHEKRAGDSHEPEDHQRMLFIPLLLKQHSFSNCLNLLCVWHIHGVLCVACYSNFIIPEGEGS